MRLALACLLLAAATAAAAADKTSLQGDLEYVCESYSAEQCKTLPRCALCTRMDGLELCFEPKAAAELSRYVFTCVRPGAEAAAEAEEAAGAGAEEEPSICQALTPGDECLAHAATCAVCDALLVKTKCYDPEEAAKLPAVVFKCEFPAAAAAAEHSSA